MQHTAFTGHTHGVSGELELCAASYRFVHLRHTIILNSKVRDIEGAQATHVTASNMVQTWTAVSMSLSVCAK